MGVPRPIRIVIMVIARSTTARPIWIGESWEPFVQISTIWPKMMI
jgi:hypothetical protein